MEIKFKISPFNLSNIKSPTSLQGQNIYLLLDNRNDLFVLNNWKCRNNWLKVMIIKEVSRDI